MEGDVLRNICLAEEDFPALFANVEHMGFASCFYNAQNGESHDSNHAILYPHKVEDLADALERIRDFYLGLGIDPSIYYPMVKGYFHQNKKTFLHAGFDVVIEEDRKIMLLRGENRIRSGKSLEVRRIRAWDERLESDILIPGGEAREIAVFRDALAHEGYYLFAGFLEGWPVVVLSLHVSPHGCTRYDYIVATKEHRNKGFGRAILSFAVEFCKEEGLPNCFTWPAHEGSERLLLEAGFEHVAKIPAGYAAYIATKRPDATHQVF